MPILRTSAGNVAYEDTGQGPPILLLHANVHDHHDYDPIVAELAAEHRVIAVDWPGHGASGSDRTVTAARCADALAELVGQLDLEPAVVVGNSVGGYAAARLALDAPGRVAGLVLVNTGGFARRTPITRAYYHAYALPLVARWFLPRIIRGYMKARSDNDRAVIDRAVALARTEAGQRTYTSMWRSFDAPEYDLTRRAARITAPTLIVWGRRDPIIPLHFGKVAARLIPNARLEVMDSGHLPFSSRPSEFLQILRPFLETVHDTPSPPEPSRTRAEWEESRPVE